MALHSKNSDQHGGERGPIDAVAVPVKVPVSKQFGVSASDATDSPGSKPGSAQDRHFAL